MSVVIIDYGMGNLGSVVRAFEECGVKHLRLSKSPEEAEGADYLILPGVGAFSKGMANLKAAGFDQFIRDKVFNDGVPLLGICLGMQLLADEGFEGGCVRGLGLIPGSVVRLEPVTGERVPHVGWNEVHQTQESPLFSNLKDATDFYFVHSYHFKTKHHADVIGTTPYCSGVASVVSRKNVFGVQFHPEKSQKPGFQLIRNFLESGHA